MYSCLELSAEHLLCTKLCSISALRKLMLPLVDPQGMVQRGFEFIEKQDYWVRVMEARFKEQVEI